MDKRQKFVLEKFTKNLSQNFIDARDDWNYMFLSKFKVDYRLISKIPGGLRDKVVLNVGTFFPIDELYFASRVREFYSVDLAADVIQFANEVANREIHPSFRKKTKINVADATSLPFEDNFFDVSFSFSTIEHIPDRNLRAKAFSELVRVTKSGGYVIITLPNKLNLGKFIRNKWSQYKGTSPFGYEHYYTPYELKKILKQLGVKPIFYCSSAGDLSGIIFRVYDFITKYFGHRMGWIGIKE